MVKYIDKNIIMIYLIHSKSMQCKEASHFWPKRTVCTVRSEMVPLT